MTSQQYIFNQLNELLVQFPEMTFSYEYHSLSETHFVHVNPLSKYSEDLNYQLAEISVTDSFINLYSGETLAFVSDESLITVKEPERIFRAATKVPNEFHKTSGFVFICSDHIICSGPIDASYNNYALAA